MKTQEIKNGSFKELYKISMPLMISFLSLFVMIFVDRIFLSRYSTNALNAATSAGTFCWSLALGWSTLASLAEVFVAQYNGAKQYKMLGIPVWQMIWLSLISLVFFIPMAIWGADLLYGAASAINFEHQYFTWTMLYSPISVLLAALTAFFVGQGKTSIIKWLALAGNIVNIILDPLFIFGLDGFIPSMGVKGACIATGIGIAVQAIVLFALFLRKQNREKYGTGDFAFKRKPFNQCVKIGMPPALFVFVELLGWAIFYWMMSKVSENHLLVSSVCQSILLLFVFFGLGIEKGAAAVAGNLIGAKKLDKVKNVLASGFKMIAMFSAVICIFFVIFPDFLMNWFIKTPGALEGNEITALSIMEIDTLKATIRTCLIFTGIYMVIEYVRWLLNGILTAAGDTMFLMVTGALCVWFFLLVPTYYFIVHQSGTMELAIMIWVGYSLLAAGIMYLRYYQGKWKKKSLLIADSEEESKEILEDNTEEAMQEGTLPSPESIPEE
ncbi:MAG: hypothetical protein S4CHLAM37_16820 [Chlamydiia bacterium]|nr:hypothetical protein [Chlamydiia bacterium]